MKKKNTSKLKCSKQSNLDFDIKKDSKYRAVFQLGPNVDKSFEFTCDEAACGNLTYDEVENMAYDIAENQYPLDSFPNMRLVTLDIWCTDIKEYCPVLSESDKTGISDIKKNKNVSRYLVLPDAVYALTQEAKLWMQLKDNGYISEDEEFNCETMHSILSKMNEKKA